MDERKSVSAQNPLKWLFLSVKSQGKWFYINIAGALADSVIVLLIAYYVRKLIDTALSSDRGQGLIPQIVVFAVLVFLGVMILWVRTYSTGIIGANVMYNLRSQLYNHIGKLSISYVESHHSAETVSSATNDVSKIENFLSFKLSRILYIPGAFVTTFIYMLIIKWNLLLFSFIVIPVVITISFLIVRLLDQYTYQLQDLIGESNSIVQDTISGIHILKSYNLKSRMMARYSENVEKTVEKGMKIVLRIASMTPLLYVLRTAPSILCIIFGGYLIVLNEMTPGQLVAFLYLLNILVGIVVDIPDLAGEVNKATGTVRHVLDVLSQPVESAEENRVLADLSKNPVDVKCVSFSYDQKVNALENIDFSVKKGSITALVGPSGSGKSTLFKLLCGYYPPREGVIEIYGIRIDYKNLSSIRSQISLVTQDPYLFPVSVAENISYGRPGADMDEIIEASKAANAHEFIMELPEGYDTMVGERGTRLSGGQKQRISIARAILKGAPILMFDEPTSALDNQSEALIQQAVENLKGDKTILVIAHRLTTIKNADEIIVFNEGKIVEKGTHSKLMEKGGFYKQLYLKQYVFNEAVNN